MSKFRNLYGIVTYMDGKMYGFLEDLYSTVDQAIEGARRYAKSIQSVSSVPYKLDEQGVGEDFTIAINLPHTKYVVHIIRYNFVDDQPL